MLSETLGNSGNYAIIRQVTGRYIFQEYEDENSLKKQIESHHGLLLIMTCLSKEAAEEECRNHNDRHFPIAGLEKWVIESRGLMQPHNQ
jgi:hypothetical protein